MVRTTPPRPADLSTLFPDLAAHATPAIRLHPRHGAPGPSESSVGGPLLWPASEPWPTCGESHSDCIGSVQRRDDVWHMRAIMDRFEQQHRANPATYRRTKQEQAELDEVLYRLVDPDLIDAAGPPPMYPVLQLYRRDVPWFLGPDDADLLQVLWCPLTHAPEYLPRVVLRWRAADVADPVDTGLLLPELVEDCYTPNPCVLDPEAIIDYPPKDELPRAREARGGLGQRDLARPERRLRPVQPRRRRSRLEDRRLPQRWRVRHWRPIRLQRVRRTAAASPVDRGSGVGLRNRVLAADRGPARTGWQGHRRLGG